MKFQTKEVETKAKELERKLSATSTEEGFIEFTEDDCVNMAPIVLEIEALKKEKNAVILAHSYLTPAIQKTVADFTGDSYGLSLEAKHTNANLIIFAAVDFMAETAKIVNPEKTVIAPNPNGGCSLADSIKGEEVERLRQMHPDHSFICYINTTAAVKAACDLTVTSSNVYAIAEIIENDKIFFLPDRLMAENIRTHLREKGIKKEVLTTDGSCYVHEEYKGEGIELIRKRFPNVHVLAHPECTPEVTSRADYVGSTSQMLKHVADSTHKDFFVLTECGLVDRLKAEYSAKNFVGSCQLCKYMKSNTLNDILRVLRDPTQGQIDLDRKLADKAKHAIEEMFRYSDLAKEKGLL